MFRKLFRKMTNLQKEALEECTVTIESDSEENLAQRECTVFIAD